MEEDIFNNIYELIEKYKNEDSDYRKHYIALMIDELKRLKEK